MGKQPPVPPKDASYILLHELPRANEGTIDTTTIKERLWVKLAPFSGLIISTVVSWLLVAQVTHKWTLSGQAYETLRQNRATVQLVLQFIATILGWIHYLALCRIFNYSSRLRLVSTPTSLDALHIWSNICSLRVDWTVRLRHVFTVVPFVSMALVPSLLWAGALAPLNSSTEKAGSLPLARYHDTQFIREYPSEVYSSDPAPLIRTPRGLFTYGVGMRLLAPLLDSAASAVTFDGSQRKHEKLDNTRFVYNGRSYGVGASVGILDDEMTGDALAKSYTFEETGLSATTNCIYNTSAEYIIEGAGADYAAAGMLPNSDKPEYSVYPAHSTTTIVAIGVAMKPVNDDRILGIAAGDSYGFLNATQCAVTFAPKKFTVAVDIDDLSINATEVDDAPDFPARNNLTHVIMRQFELIANDQTSFYLSVVGESFNNSIASYNTSLAMRNSSATTTESKSTLAGLEQSVTAMVDDMLVAYASAQLMIAEDTYSVPTTVQIQAMIFGANTYIWLVFALNLAVVILFAAEALRTRAWDGLLTFNYMDPKDLITASSRGGIKLEKAISRQSARTRVRFAPEFGAFSTETKR